MIALQAKGPKLADPAAQTAKFVNMMNMTKQQEAAERQAAQAQQAMTLAQRKDAREEALQGPALTKAEIDNVRAQIDDLEEQYKMVSTDEGHQFWLNRVRKISPEIADQIGMFAPAFDREKVNNIMLTAKQAVDKIDPDAKATIEYAGKGGVDEQGNPVPEGTAIQVITGKKPSTQVIRNAPNAAAPAPAAAPQTTTGAVQTGKFGETLVTPDSARPLTPYQQDHIRQMQEGLGMSNTPASFNSGSMGTPTAGQMSPDMVPAILDSAVKTGVMAQIDLDQMLAMAPPQAKQGIMDVIRSNKIALQADAPSLAASGMGQQQPPMAPNPVQRPDAGFAVYRGGQPPQSRTANLDGDMSMMRNTEVQYQPLQRRDPNVSPTPSPVPAGVLGAQEGAKTTASKNVELEMNPKIAAATKKAERAVERIPEALQAKNEAKVLIQGYDRYIETIDKLLRSPDRHRIIGRLEGNLHYLGSFGQDERQAELQAMFDMIKSADTLKTLVEAKQATPTGGSPVGNASNTDVQLVAKSANAVTQAGGVAKFDEGLKQLRREAYRGRQNTIEFYGDRYGDLAAEDPKFKLNARAIADRYISSKDLPKSRARPQTSTKVDRNNPLLRD
jgi:hypothetical protein